MQAKGRRKIQQLRNCVKQNEEFLRKLLKAALWRTNLASCRTNSLPIKTQCCWKPGIAIAVWGI
jgi:hypothetical protein